MNKSKSASTRCTVTHMLEIASGGLQIAIVLASISVVINLPAFMMVSIIVASASVIYGVLGGFSILH